MNQGFHTSNSNDVAGASNEDIVNNDMADVPVSVQLPSQSIHKSNENEGCRSAEDNDLIEYDCIAEGKYY